MKLLLPLLMMAIAIPAFAQDKLPPEQRINGKEVLDKFESAKAVIEASVVQVRNEKGELVSFGTVIAPDQVVTKASTLIGQRGINFTLPGGKEVVPKRVDRRADNDLALFTVPDGKLKPVAFAPAKDFPQGAWLITASANEVGMMAGVKAANPRLIKKQTGVIGVILGRDGARVGGVLIDSVAPKGGAKEAGLQKGDVIIELEGIVIVQQAELKKELAKHEPGATLKIKVKRDDEEIDFEVLLGHREHIFAQFNSIAQISGPTSKRKSGFADIIQHDIPLSVSEMGGPMLNVKGECIGINISRINRAENYALPSEVVQQFIANEETDPPQIAATEPKTPPPSEPKTPEPEPKSDPEPSEEPDPEDAPGPAPAFPAGPVEDPMLDLDGNEVEPYELDWPSKRSAG